MLDLIPDSDNITKVKLSTSAPVEIDGYLLYSLPANHSTDIKGETALNFVISKDKALLYAMDGGGINFNSPSSCEGLNTYNARMKKIMKKYAKAYHHFGGKCEKTPNCEISKRKTCSNHRHFSITSICQTVYVISVLVPLL